MLVGLYTSHNVSFPNLTDGISWLSYGRLRPYILMPLFFALVGNAFAGMYYSLQRLLKGCTVTFK
jgi:cbb3-type cytochrome oxidase subunit 1